MSMFELSVSGNQLEELKRMGRIEGRFDLEITDYDLGETVKIINDDGRHCEDAEIESCSDGYFVLRLT